MQSIESPPNRAFYTNLAKPIEISENKIVVAFSKEMFVKQAREGAKRQALVDAVSKYLNIPNPVIEVVLGNNIPQKTTTTVTPPVQKPKEEVIDIKQQEEEEYQNFVMSKDEQKSAPQKPVDSSSQAAMVKDLFGGKFID